MAAELCADCGTVLVGPCCHECGQKRIADDDRRLIALLRDFFEDMSRFDSRWWRSLIALLFRPGVLSRAWLEGKRTRYAKPAALFLFANLIYFVAPVLSDFNLPLAPQINIQAYSPIIRPWVERRVAARAQSQPGYRLEDYARVYNARAEAVGKALIILHVPFLALALLLLFWSRKYYYAEHFGVALNLFTFFLLAFQILPDPLEWALSLLQGSFPLAQLHWASLVLLAAIPTCYFTIALKRTYRCGWIYAFCAGAALLPILLGVNLWIYRPTQFALTFLLT